jgi:hypothetical protein
MKVVRDLETGRGSASHNAKATRGLVVRSIVGAAQEPRRPEELADTVAAEHFAVRLRPPGRPGQTWELHVVESATVKT